MERETNAKLQWAGIGLAAIATLGIVYACNSRASDAIESARQERAERASIAYDMMYNINTTETLK